MLRVPNESAKTIDRKESSDALVAEVIRENDDLKVLVENIELVSELASWSKALIDSTSSSPGMSYKVVPDA